jgi:hypothetical protein
MTRLASRVRRMEARHAPTSRVQCFAAYSDADADRVQDEMTASGKIGAKDTVVRLIITAESAL